MNSGKILKFEFLNYTYLNMQPNKHTHSIQIIRDIAICYVVQKICCTIYQSHARDKSEGHRIEPNRDILLVCYIIIPDAYEPINFIITREVVDYNRGGCLNWINYKIISYNRKKYK